MRNPLLFVGAVALAVSVAACGSTSPTSSDAADSGLSADAALQAYVDAIRPLKSIGVDPASDFRRVEDALGPLGGSMSLGIEGVPDDIAFDAGVKTGAFAVGVGLVVTCMENSPADCEGLIQNAGSLASESSAAMAELLPYSTWTREDFLARIRE